MQSCRDSEECYKFQEDKYFEKCRLEYDKNEPSDHRLCEPI